MNVGQLPDILPTQEDAVAELCICEFKAVNCH
jgi:hypothetical protein